MSQGVEAFSACAAPYRRWDRMHQPPGQIQSNILNISEQVHLLIFTITTQYLYLHYSKPRCAPKPLKYI